VVAETIGGVINVAKEAGPTSHDVVDMVRRGLGIKRVGHGGTLDPAARGVLPVLFGRVTRLAGFFADYRKRYRAVVELGRETTTGDGEGDVAAERTVPDDAFDRLEAVVRSFVGEIDQEVPAYSAVKVGGEPLYRRARRGEEVAAPSRRVSVFVLEVEEIAPPAFTLFVECGSGTYVRALARDIGRALDTGAYLKDLTRLAVGPFSLEDALPQARLAEGPGVLLSPPHYTPAAAMLPDVPAVELSPVAVADVARGREVGAAPWLRPGARVRLLDHDGRNLVGVGVALGGGRVRPDMVFVSPEESSRS